MPAIRRVRTRRQRERSWVVDGLRRRSTPAVWSFALLLLSATPGVAGAEPPPQAPAETPAAAPPRTTTIVLVEPEAPSLFVKEALTRLAGELRAAGFGVVRLTSAKPDPRGSLEEALATSGAAAGIVLERDEDRARAEIWVSDRLTGKLSVRPLSGDDGPSVLAVRAVELLRASLLELEPEATPPGIERAPIDALVKAPPAKKPSPLASLRAGLGVEVSFVTALHPEVGAFAFAPALRAFGSADMGLGGRLTVVAPMLGTELEGALGIARISTELFLGELLYTPPLSEWVNLTVALGAGGMHLAATGELDEPARARSEDLGALVIAPSVGLVARVAGPLALTLEGGAVFALPPPRIEMGDEELGVLARPTISVSHGVLVGF